MGDFFHGWRRKIGVVTLVVACVGATAWIRSMRLVEVVYIGRPQPTQIYFNSAGGYFKFAILHDGTENNTGSIIEWHNQPIELRYSVIIDGPSFASSWTWTRNGFSVGRESIGPFSRIVRNYAILPYWSIVIPLTLLSAWLLLSKPRVAKPPEKPA